MPTEKKPQKRARSSRKPAEFFEFSMFGMRGRYQVTVQGAKRVAEVEIHEGKAEMLVARINLAHMSGFGPGVLDPEAKQKIAAALTEVAYTISKAMPSKSADKARQRAALQAQTDAQFAYVEGILGHKPEPAEVFYMTPEQVGECRKTGEDARNEALAKYDAAIEAALKGKGE